MATIFVVLTVLRLAMAFGHVGESIHSYWNDRSAHSEKGSRPREMDPKFATGETDISGPVQHAARDAFFGSQPRELDRTSPDLVCAAFNNASAAAQDQNITGNPLLNCTCNATQNGGVFLACLFTEAFCSIDNSTCYIGGYDITLDNQALSLEVTSCTNVTANEWNPSVQSAATMKNATAQSSPASICTTVFPISAGNYSQLASCSSVLNGQACRSCNSCHLNDDPNATGVYQIAPMWTLLLNKLAPTLAPKAPPCRRYYKRGRAVLVEGMARKNILLQQSANKTSVRQINV
jgi:hypothetical protein